MNMINQTIPATFCSETSFTVALSESDPQSENMGEVPAPFRCALPGDNELGYRGIPESAIND